MSVKRRDYDAIEMPPRFDYVESESLLSFSAAAFLLGYSDGCGGPQERGRGRNSGLAGFAYPAICVSPLFRRPNPVPTTISAKMSGIKRSPSDGGSHGASPVPCGGTCDGEGKTHHTG